MEEVRSLWLQATEQRSPSPPANLQLLSSYSTLRTHKKNERVISRMAPEPNKSETTCMKERPMIDSFQELPPSEGTHLTTVQMTRICQEPTSSVL